MEGSFNPNKEDPTSFYIIGGVKELGSNADGGLGNNADLSVIDERDTYIAVFDPGVRNAFVDFDMFSVGYGDDESDTLGGYTALKVTVQGGAGMEAGGGVTLSNYMAINDAVEATGSAEAQIDAMDKAYNHADPITGFQIDPDPNYPVTFSNGQSAFVNAVLITVEHVGPSFAIRKGYPGYADPSGYRDIEYGFGTGSSIYGPPRVPTRPGPTLSLQGNHTQYNVIANGDRLLIQDTVGGRDGVRIATSETKIHTTDGFFIADATGSVENVNRLYQAALGRLGDADGLVYWGLLIDNSNVPLQAVANNFASSPEFIQHYGSLSDSGFVEQLYQNVLSRSADPSGLNYWSSILASGGTRGDVLVGFSQSQEFKAKTIATGGDVNNAEAYRLYVAALNRAPEDTGLAYWSSELQSGVTPTQVAQNLVNSAEFQKDYNGLSPSDFVSDLYRNVLHRAGDPTGVQSWVQYLQNGGSEAGVVVGFADSPENRAATSATTHANFVFIPQ